MICASAHASAEPGMIFLDTVNQNGEDPNLTLKILPPVLG